MAKDKLSTPFLDSLQKQKNMKATKMYRVTLFENSNSLAETLAVLAAKSNGCEKKYSLQDLNDVAKGQIILYPSMNENTTCELIGSHILHLDKKVKDKYETVLKLEEVEIMELDVPTLSAYEAKEILTGLADEKNHELLN